MYAVVAPGLKGVYEDYSMIERILSLYPYTKFRKFDTEAECWEFINRNENKHKIEEITNFGDTFDKHRVIMEYFINNSTLYFNFNTKNLGTLRLINDRAIIENRNGLIKAQINNVVVDSEKIQGHIIAIYQGIKLLGDFIDVEVIVPDHSIFYAIRSYTGTDRTIKRLQDYLRTRQGKVSVTLRR